MNVAGLLNSTATSDIGIFMVVYNNGNTGTSVLFAKGLSDYASKGIYNGDGEFVYNRSGVAVVNSVSLSLNTWTVIESVRTSNTARGYKNGTLIDTDNNANHTDTAQDFYIGTYDTVASNNNAKADIGEMHICVTTISDGTRQSNESWLNSKWQIF